ncbi:hypothetical protein [Ammoniphilus sp. CFH 90114]|uniref:hypothetical protein n=1 Tax=Ammoniphilus sp. CFH 90114 TaxID=2493665 RepID=UPI00100E2BFE|nr:hypothetical protein [Ammoniphilus sp. CFH 90114]RXT14684.1 hypothetical protein EIZ39_00250 [Ammoniphilus sp. CFH 90114]
MKSNQKGFALLTVVLIIVIFTVLGTALLGLVFQSFQHRMVATEEIQGKMLAEAGLQYFQRSVETSVSTPGHDVNAVVTQFLKEKFSSPQDGKEKFTEYKLPNGAGSFAIMYNEKNTVEFKNPPFDPYSQPFSKEVEVSVIGIPTAAEGDRNQRLMRVRLDATVYINTVPSAFHYALSTPNELRLFGGSNIIGNISAKKILTTVNYRTSSYSNELNKDIPEAHPGPSYNQPYIEGVVFVENGLGNIPMISSFSSLTPTDPLPPSVNIESASRKHLRAIFRPLDKIESNGLISADPTKPYYPGMEPPLVKKAQTSHSLFSDNVDLADFIHSEFASIEDSSKLATVERDSPPIMLEDSSNKSEPISWTDGFQQLDLQKSTNRTAFIETRQGNFRSSDHDGSNADGFLPTARLTSDLLQANYINKLYIGPQAIKNKKLDSDLYYLNNNASVEMGRTNSFSIGVHNDKDTPFTFSGTIYIKGDLDIVGDVNINGSIFVDGNVVIREISNLANQNLVIISTGIITLSNRYIDETTKYNDDLTLNENYVPVNQWNTLSPFSAYLYSEKTITVYSSNSFNWIYGGLATGSGLNPQANIELNTLRESNDDDLAARFVLQFNRGIFEKPTPGLPHANRLYTNSYDLTYRNFQESIVIEKSK